MSTPPPFGIILPSRPVLINAATISSTQYAFTFPSTPSFSHIVVFLLPGAALPNETLTGVYIQLPDSTEFKFLGAIGMEKPSAIFRVNAGGGGGVLNGIEAAAEDEMTDSDDVVNVHPPPPPPGGKDVTLGLSIEPAANITAQLQLLKESQMALVPAARRGHQPQTTGPLSTKILAQRIIKNAYNFLGSFAGSAGPGGQEVVPLKSFQDWWTKFERRVENDPGFLEREGSGD